MSALVPPQGDGRSLPAQGTARGGPAKKRRGAAPGSFAAALLSLVPPGKNRRKEKNGKEAPLPTLLSVEKNGLIPLPPAIVAADAPRPSPKKGAEVPLPPRLPSRSGGNRVEGNQGKRQGADGGEPATVALPEDAPRTKRPPAGNRRANVAADGAFSPPATPDPVRTDPRTAGPPSPGSRNMDPSLHPARKGARSDREGPDGRKDAPDAAGTKPGNRTKGKGDSEGRAPFAHGATAPADDAPERRAPRGAASGDPKKGGSFSGLPAAASSPASETRNAEAPAPSTAAAPSREAPIPFPLFEQVAMKMTPLPDGAHDVEIRLSPDRLGKLNIALHIDSGRMDAFVQTDSAETRALLLREEPALREALRNAGVTLSSFHVALSGESWRERRGAGRPDGEADSPARRGRKEKRVEGILSVKVEEGKRDGTGRTEHWIA